MPATQPPSRSPDELAASLTTRWNQQDPEAIIALFSPTRRALAMRHGAMIAERLGGAMIVHIERSRVCSPRGPNFALWTLDLLPRDADEARSPAREELWVVSEGGAWWLYSL